MNETERGAGDNLDELARELLWVRASGAHSRDAVIALDAAGFKFAEPGYWRLELAGGVEVALEPLMFGRFALAVYRNLELVHERKLEVVLHLDAGEATGTVSDE